MTGRGSTLGVLMIVKDNAACLPRSLGSVKWADEVVVVDSGSRDESVSIALEFGAKVLTRPFTDFAEQRNFALDNIRSDWVLCLDADEAVTPELRGQIQDVLAADQAVPVAYLVPRRNYLGDRWLRHGGLYPDLSPRLFRLGAGRYVGAVHEVLDLSGEVGRLPGDIEHHTYADVADLFAKVERYARMEGRTRCSGDSTGRLLARIPVRFLRTYFLRQGFRDGRLGLIHAWAQVRYSWLIFQEARRLRQASATPEEEA